MKYLIQGIGVLTALFTVFFFLLVADKLYYRNSTAAYDISLDRRLSGRQVQDAAEEAGVTFRITYYNDTNFGHHDLEMVFINPAHITEGKQPSIFPDDNIIYSVFDAGSGIKLQYFTLLSENEADADRVTELFSRYGVQADVTKNDPVKFHAGMLFSTLNLSFFLLLTVLLFLSIAACYVHRLKEIGVLKLNGWTGWGITFRLIMPLSVRSYTAMLAVIFPAGGYILYKDSSVLGIFLAMTLWICCFLAIVFLTAALGGLFFIRKVDRVGAVKNNRNNKLIFGVLLVFKAVVTVMLILSMNTTVDRAVSLQATNAAINKLKQYDLYKLATPVVPEDSAMELYNSIIGSCKDTDVFNYAVVSGIYSTERLKTAEIKAAGELMEADQLGFTQMSANLLSVIELLDENGQVLRQEDFSPDETVLLVPVHFQKELSEILAFYDASPDTRVVYLQDGQIQNILTRPGRYTFDSIYRIQPLQKVLYLNQGEVLLTKGCSEYLQQEFLDADADGSSIRIESQNIEYGIFQGNISLSMCESLFRVVINLASFVLCAVAAAVIFLELRKKEIGVYRLLGRYPLKAVGMFAGINLISTILMAIIVWSGFLLLAFLEGMLYGVLIRNYLHQKAVPALKGA